MKQSKAQYLVVDSGAFIKNAPIHEYGENVFTVQTVVQEIRDKATKQRLQVLPYELKFREPTPENVKYVTEFSKKTGDYPSLSAVDIQVIALTYQLEKEHVGTDHLNKEPVRGKVTAQPAEVSRNLIGFYYPDKEEEEEESDNAEGEENDKESDHSDYSSDPEEEAEPDSSKPVEEAVPDSSKLVEEAVPDSSKLVEEAVPDSSKLVEEAVPDSSKLVEEAVPDSSKLVEEAVPDSSKLVEEAVPDSSKLVEEAVPDSSKLVEEAVPDSLKPVEEAEPDFDLDDCYQADDDNHWITPFNIDKIKKKMGALSITDDDSQSITVACITTDFAVQNMLLQMGLHVISVDGMLIKHTKVFILRCYACYRTTSIMTKQFCSGCGNKTLKRVAVSINEDGSKKIHINFRKPINIRGTKYSLPKPRGGKHSGNPVLCEDQPIPQNRPSKAALTQVDMFNTGYEVRSSPFAMNDVYSRAAQLGIRKANVSISKRNPNEPVRRIGKKKRNKRT